MQRNAVQYNSTESGLLKPWSKINLGLPSLAFHTWPVWNSCVLLSEKFSGILYTDLRIHTLYIQIYP